MVEKPPNPLAVTTPLAGRMEGCATQTPKNKRKPHAAFVKPPPP
jgi:hypothetical protein